MNDKDLAEFLKTRRWHHAQKSILVAEFNSRLRPFDRPIKINHVSTPCRLRQVVGSLLARIEDKTPAEMAGK